MTDLQPLFDYAALAPDMREMVQEHTGEIRKLARRAAQDIVEIGERLIEVKAALGHGQFEGWVTAEFGWSTPSARRFMQVAEAFKTLNLSDLNIAPSALYALASGSTPDFIREEVVEMAQATGQRVTHQQVKERLAAHIADVPPPVEEPEETQEPAPIPPLPPMPQTAPLTALDNAEMAQRKKEPYTPLPVELEERETSSGEKVLVPALPTPPRKLEIKEKDWQKAADRFESTASGALTYLGKLAAYTPDELQKIMDSPEGRQVGTEVRIRQLQARMQELMTLLAEPEAQKTLDAEPLTQVLPPERDKDKALELN